MRKAVLSILFFLYILMLSAQQFEGGLPSVFPPSPEVAALGNFIDTPMSYATGVPTIAVPVIELSGKVPIPISIGYHAGGVKVGTFSSRVGLGWNLNAGGSITRSVRGSADDGVYEPHNGYMEPDVKTVSDFLNASNKEYFINQYKGNDFQSDIYNYSFLGQSGSFLLDQDDTSTISGFPISVIQNPKTDNSIVPMLNNAGKLEGWTIITPDGTQYDFGRSKIDGRTAVNLSNTLAINNFAISQDSNHSYNETWELMDIKTSNGDITSFFYNFNYIQFRTLTGEQHILGAQGSNSSSIQYSDNSNTTHNLIGIVNAQGRVELKYDRDREDLIGDKVLTGVKLYDKNDRLIDAYTLFQSYYDSNGFINNIFTPFPGKEGQRTKRLRLDSITQTINSTSNKTFSFLYHEGQLPDRLSFSQDYWGFFNGISNRWFAPKVYYKFNGLIRESPTGGNRSVQENKTKIGTLKRVTYPTGGYTEYEYESNRAEALEAPLALSFNAYDMVPILPAYDINPSGNGPAPALEIPFDPLVYTGGLFINITDAGMPENVDCSESGKVGCPEIKVYAVGGASNRLLFSSFGTAKFENTFPLESEVDQILVEYSWPDRPPNSTSPTLNIIGYKPPNNGFKIGGLRVKNIASYSKEGKLAKSENIKYTRFNNSNQSSGIINNQPVFVQENGHFTFENGEFIGHNVLQANVLLPLNNYGSNVIYTQVTSTLEGSGRPGKIEREFSAPDLPTQTFADGIYRCGGSCLSYQIPKQDFSHRHGLLLNERVYSQDQSNIFIPVKETTKIYEFRADDYYVENFVFKDLSNSYGMYVDYKLYYNVGERQYLKKEITKDFFTTDDVISSTEYFYDTGYQGRVIPTSTIKTSSNDNKLIKTETDYPHDRPAGEPYMSQLINANRIAEPIEVRKIFLNNGSPTLLHTTRTQYSSFNGLYLPKFVSTLKGGQVPIQTSELDNRIIYHDYDNYGNPIDVSEAGGTRSAYIWGYNNQYPVAKVENATYAQATASNLNLNLSKINNPATSIELENEIKKIRIGLPKAQVTTYTYDPLVGIKTIIDPNGNKTTYHYDDFGRFKYVEDHDGNVLSENEYHYKN